MPKTALVLTKSGQFRFTSFKQRNGWLAGRGGPVEPSLRTKNSGEPHPYPPPPCASCRTGTNAAIEGFSFEYPTHRRPPETSHSRQLECMRRRLVFPGPCCLRLVAATPGSAPLALALGKAGGSSGAEMRRRMAGTYSDCHWLIDQERLGVRSTLPVDVSPPVTPPCHSIC